MTMVVRALVLGTLVATGCGSSAGAGPVEADIPAAPPVADRAVAPPVPEPAVAPAPEPAAPPPSFGHADLDPENDQVVGPPEPLADCEQRLAAAGITFKRARIGVGRKRDGVYTCGAKQVVRYRRGPGDIAYSSNPLLTCSMALALADFERVAQEQAQAELGTRIAKIDHMGTYNCREMAAYDLISEHSFANGIDLRRFHFENGKTITVKGHFQPEVTDPTVAGTRFLRTLANRLFDEQVFSVVVTPFFDRLHHNHIHVDLARYRVDGSRP